MGYQYTIVAGSGNDTFNVYPRDAAGNPTINGLIGFFGSGGSDIMNLNDTLASTGTTWAISNPCGSSTQNFLATGDASIGVFNDVESINLYGAPGSNTFNVNQYQSGSSFNIYGNTGSDICNFGNNNLSTNVTNISQFTFDGGGGSDVFNLNSLSDATGTYTYTGAALSYTSTGSYFITLTLANTELTNIYPSTVGPIVRVTGVSSGTTVAAHAEANSVSPAQLQVGNTTVSGIAGAIAFYGNTTSGGTIIVDDSNDLTTRIVHLTQSTLGAFPGDNFFPTGGSLTFSNIKASISPGLTLRMPGRPNSIYAQPNPTGTVSIAGGFSSSLVLALAAAQNYVLHGTASSGSVTSSNLQTLSWTFLASFPTVDAVAPTVAQAQINVDGAPGAGPMASPPVASKPSFDVTFSEPVALLAGVGTLELTNVTLGQIVPSSSLAVSYNAATVTAHYTFPGFPNGVPPDANYHVRVLAGATADLPGNALAADAPFDFFILSGDANHDRFVDTSDFTTLAQNFGSTSATFSQGDFNYDGQINALDFNILATQFGTYLAPPAAVALSARLLSDAPPAASSSLFSNQPVLRATGDELLNNLKRRQRDEDLLTN
jgi:hypothetical protein